ncbi:MAG: hypothetical protein ABI723_11880 [Bacteroidia bacterium]
MKRSIYFIALIFAFSNAKSQSLNETQTKQIFDFLFGMNASSGLTINEEDKKKASFFLNELIDGSCKMSLAQGLLEGAFPIKTTISESVEQIAKAIIKSSYKNCYKGAMEGNFYESVKVTLARNWKSPFEIRKQTGEW